MESVATSVPNDLFGTELVREWAPEGQPRAVMVLVHGHAEHSGRYEKTGSLFAEAGFLVRSFDLVGAGASGGPRWDTDDWSVFHEQLQRHVEWAIGLDLPVILMGHSTGGTIALGYIDDHRPKPTLLILSTPLIELRAGWQKAIVPFLAKIVPKLWIPAPTKVEDLSHDPAVGEAYDADPLVVQGATVRFGMALLEEMQYVQSSWDALDIPTLVFHGGMDKLVPPQSTAPMADLPTVERRLYPELRHETMNEPEGPEVVQDVIDWINEQI
jgi:alpha-beta hydrolase superfamily lysophospholipase